MSGAIIANQSRSTVPTVIIRAANVSKMRAMGIRFFVFVFFSELFVAAMAG